MTKFNDIPFHDAYILGVEFRTIENHFDYIGVTLESEEFTKYFGKSKLTLVFRECYIAIVNLCIFIENKDTIRSAYMLDKSDLLDEVKNKGDMKLIFQDDTFFHFSFELNTTEGTINLIAKEVEFITECN